jgi:mRNA-degrading endonuclease RelE of RelBE toxin-antitoxin system
MPKTLTIRVDEKTYDAFVKRAKVENRSVANFIENAVRTHIQEHDFVDDVEMAEILANERLVERLKNWEPRTWRYRVGAWRFFYEIDEEHHLVLMTVADHRSRANDR